MSVPCQKSVDHEIPLECWFKYLGQTSRCINEKLTEHKRNPRNKASNFELAKHLKQYHACEANWSKTEVSHKEHNHMKRAVQETIR